MLSEQELQQKREKKKSARRIVRDRLRRGRALYQSYGGSLAKLNEAYDRKAVDEAAGKESARIRELARKPGFFNQARVFLSNLVRGR